MQTYRNRAKFHAFSEYDLSRIIEGQGMKVTNLVRDEKEAYLLNVNRDDYVKHLAAEEAIDPIEFQFDQLSITPEEMLIPAEMYSAEFSVRAGRSYPRLVVTYHLPFTGDPTLLKVTPSIFGTWTPLIWTEGKSACFDFVDFRQDAEALRKDADGIVGNLRQNAERVNTQVNQFNAGLPARIEQAFDQRKQQLIQRSAYLRALKVPIRNVAQTSPTYAAPAPKKIEPITPRPTVKDRDYRPEPTLDDEIYHQVLKVIHNLGTGFEKLPSTYVDKDEETLRDHFLIGLAPNFAGSVTGETFNKSGKTDILLRHEQSNLFVAECKFWRGPKSCDETLNQLISYLTWRDSKAAVIFFVRNQDFGEVLTTVREVLPKHPNYLGELPASSASWFNYRFHVAGDRNREIKVAVLLFHFPPKA